MRSVLAVSPEWGHDVCFVLSSRWSVKGPWFVFFFGLLLRVGPGGISSTTRQQRKKNKLTKQRERERAYSVPTLVYVHEQGALRGCS